MDEIIVQVNVLAFFVLSEKSRQGIDQPDVLPNEYDSPDNGKHPTGRGYLNRIAIRGVANIWLE